jgi:hypothetical protein
MLDEACAAACANGGANVLRQAYDSHCNLVLGDVEETIFVAEEEEEGQEARVRTVKKQSEMLFVRGTQLWNELFGVGG